MIVELHIEFSLYHIFTIHALATDPVNAGGLGIYCGIIILEKFTVVAML